MIKCSGIVVLVMLFLTKSSAQHTNAMLPIQFKLKFNTTEVSKGTPFISAKGDTLSLETFKCYISNVKLEFTDKTQYKESNSYHLLDLDSVHSFKFELPKTTNKKISKITFNVGIDSTTSTSGIQNGVLDPMNGMYWAWQSGYINFKIEGKSSSCNTRHHKFQFHIGGYRAPNDAMRTVALNCKDNNIVIAIDLATFFKEIELSKDNTLMIPGAKAMELADLTKTIFQLE